ncbi:Cytochrome P450 [Glarea lozoyensis ATCC 20868]|uniref:Cytochrome P450 n=1 Tax=Glarea lozoyensis (strain ATCC 20868 / MF5171) TaxID=1116229 RepID=S3D964_GLAL2|nr:Cytochrome P450 [Glarea lozoyensis ATCC 20868]EPE34250.1 Cytochrome P450 [Glarea lozoyensis ATCC 20868]
MALAFLTLVNAIICFTLLAITIIIYRLYFHPLASYPGPPLWVTSQLPSIYTRLMERQPYHIVELHQKYGSVVRIAPNELAFTTEKAWYDIYGKPDRKLPELRKDPSMFLAPPNGVYGMIFEPSEKGHARMRGVLSNGFSRKAVADQEPCIARTVNRFINKLGESCGKQIDMVPLYHFVFLDIIGDLTFGESFNCVENWELHFWPKMVFEFIKIGNTFAIAKKFSPLDKILAFLAPPSLRKSESQIREFIKEKVIKRLEAPGIRSDFLSNTQASFNTPEGMNFDEIVETSLHLIVAGSETGSTTLATATYFLLANPQVLSKLNSEIREAFKNEEEITFLSASRLQYLTAVINEVFRCLPPVPAILPRVTPPNGCIIDGRFVPGNTVVGISQWAAYHLETNFRRPYDFVPERWLGDVEFKDDKRQVVKPFSVGQRNCIGQTLAMAELGSVLAKMLWNFDMELCEDSVDWKDDMKVYIVYQKRPLNVVLTRRK